MCSANLSVSDQRERRLQERDFQMGGANSRKRLQLSRFNVDRTSEQVHWAQAQLAESHSIVKADWSHHALCDDHIVLQGC